MRFDYWVIRYVPDPVRGEFVNLGVIAGAGSQWQFRKVSSLQRASRLGGSATATRSFLTRIGDSIDSELHDVAALIDLPGEHTSAGFLEDLRTRMNGIVQLSAPRPIRAQTVDDAADIAFDLMVVDNGPVTRHRSRTQVAQHVLEAFTHDPQVSRHLARARQARVDNQRVDYDVAVTGDVTVQVNRAWSFTMRDTSRLETNIQAWSYMMGRLRAEGGELVRPRNSKSPTVEIPADVQANVIYRAPITEEGKRVMTTALRNWDRLEIQAVQEGETSRLVREARELIEH